jgi:hypothetical protein
MDSGSSRSELGRASSDTKCARTAQYISPDRRKPRSSGHDTICLNRARHGRRTPSSRDRRKALWGAGDVIKMTLLFDVRTLVAKRCGARPLPASDELVDWPARFARQLNEPLLMVRRRSDRSRDRGMKCSTFNPSLLPRRYLSWSATRLSNTMRRWAHAGMLRLRERSNVWKAIINRWGTSAR